MQTAEQSAEPVTREARAEWFLEQLDQQPIQAGALMDFVGRQYQAGRRSEADELAELLEAALVEGGRLEAAVEVLHLSTRLNPDPAFAAHARGHAERLLKGDRDRQVFIEPAFAEGLQASEAVRRLLLLLRLQPGVLCLDKTWGFGVVDSVDAFYKRVRIDFRGKPGHEMSFDYAAGTLDLISDDHLLARRHRAPEEMANLVATHPGEVVMLALASFGPMPVVRLQEILVPDLVDDGKWKAFWDSARKALKANPLVEFPARRSDPIVLHAEVQQQDEAWFEGLRAERGLKKLVDQIEQLYEASDPETWPPNAADVLADRLAFVLKGAEGRHPDLLARALMLAEASGLPRAVDEAAVYLRKALHPAALLGAVEDLSVRHLRAYLAYLLERHGDASADLLLGQLGYLPLAPLSEVLDALEKHGREQACREALALLLDEHPAGVHILNWAARNLERVARWDLVAPGVLANEMLTALELMEGGNRSKERSQLIAQFENKAWLKDVLAAMNTDQRSTYLHRVKGSTAFPDRGPAFGAGGHDQALPGTGGRACRPATEAGIHPAVGQVLLLPELRVAPQATGEDRQRGDPRQQQGDRGGAKLRRPPGEPRVQGRQGDAGSAAAAPG